jgi:hypothetical protein
VPLGVQVAVAHFDRVVVVKIGHRVIIPHPLARPHFGGKPITIESPHVSISPALVEDGTPLPPIITQSSLDRAVIICPELGDVARLAEVIGVISVGGALIANQQSLWQPGPTA